ncbi:hypothetical protein D3C75_1220700 [compost metagenome]
MRHPTGQQAAKVGGRQHAVGKHIGLARAACKIEVDMHLVVIAGSTGIQRQRGAIDRWQLQRRECVTHL